jgi:hypothetical protein
MRSDPARRPLPPYTRSEATLSDLDGVFVSIPMEASELQKLSPLLNNDRY